MKTCLYSSGLLFTIAVMANLTMASEPAVSFNNPASSGAATLDVIHTAAADSGGIPASLQKYGKYLQKAGSKNWKQLERKQTKPTPGSSKTVNLPGNLGKAVISLDGKGVATVKIMDKGGKSLGSYRSSRFPLVIANQRLRINGKPYVLILDKPKKK